MIDDAVMAALFTTKDPDDVTPPPGEPALSPAEDAEATSEGTNADEALFDEDPDAGQDDDQDDDQDADDEADDGTPELTDDTLIEVRVDGEVQEVSLRDLKTAYAGEGAVRKRLGEATQARREATEAREAALVEANRVRQGIANLANVIDQALHAQLVPPPDNALRTSNPAQYLRQLEAHQADQQRVGQQRQQLLQLFQEQGKQIEQAMQQNRTENMRQLQALMPELFAPATKAEVSRDLFDAGRHYGFADDEIKSGADYRFYLMANDAQKYRKLMADSGKLPNKVDAQPKKTMRPGKGATNKGQTERRRIEALRARAKQTGKLEDVAATLIVKPKR